MFSTNRNGKSVQLFVLYSDTRLCLISRTDLKIMSDPPPTNIPVLQV